MIVGAQKSGTTSLLRYLAQHPQLTGQAPLEIGYFFEPAEWNAGWERAYARYFYDAESDLLVAKSAMLYVRRFCIERLAEHNPDCQVILVLRDPVERAFSSYRMERARGAWIDKPFDHIVTVVDDREDLWNRLFIRPGEYAPAVRELHEFFGASQLTVLIHDEFVRDPVSACQEVFRRLGVDAGFTPETSVTHNPHRDISSEHIAALVRWLRGRDNVLRRAAKRALPPRMFDRLADRIAGAGRTATREHTIAPDTREALASYYAPLNRDLASLLGRDLSRWTGMA